MIRSYRVGSIPTRATINNPLNNKTMELLFVIGVICFFTSSYLFGISDVLERRILAIISILLLIISGITVMIVGLAGINGAFAKEIRCKKYQIDKIENITVVNNDTTKTVDYVIHDIKR